MIPVSIPRSFLFSFSSKKKKIESFVGINIIKKINSHFFLFQALTHTQTLAFLNQQFLQHDVVDNYLTYHLLPFHIQFYFHYLIILDDDF